MHRSSVQVKLPQGDPEKIPSGTENVHFDDRLHSYELVSQVLKPQMK